MLMGYIHEHFKCLDQLHQLTPGFPSGSELPAATMWLIPQRLMRRCPLLGINGKSTLCNWSTSWHRRNSPAVHTILGIHSSRSVRLCFFTILPTVWN